MKKFRHTNSHALAKMTLIVLSSLHCASQMDVAASASCLYASGLKVTLDKSRITNKKSTS